MVAVYVFGSFARGNAAPGSDVDLLVVLRHDPRPPRGRIVDYLPRRFPVGLDVVPWTEAEFDARLASGDRMARTILEEGEALFDRKLTARRALDGEEEDGHGSPRALSRPHGCRPRSRGAAQRGL